MFPKIRFRVEAFWVIVFLGFIGVPLFIRVPLSWESTIYPKSPVVGSNVGLVLVLRSPIICLGPGYSGSGVMIESSPTMCLILGP